MTTFARQRGRLGLGTFWNEDATSGLREARDQGRDQQRCSGYRVLLSTQASASGSERKSVVEAIGRFIRGIR
jgi:hypothetical protein